VFLGERLTLVVSRLFYSVIKMVKLQIPAIPVLSIRDLTRMRQRIIQDEVLLSCVGHRVDSVILEKLYAKLKALLPKDIEGKNLSTVLDIELRNKLLTWDGWVHFVSLVTGNIHKIRAGESVQNTDVVLTPEWRMLRIDHIAPSGLSYEFSLRILAGIGCPATIKRNWKQSRVDYLWDILLGLTYRTRDRYLYRTIDDFLGCYFWGLATTSQPIIRFETTKSQQKQNKGKFNGSYDVSSAR
jgi:hypothetical protein